MFAVYKQRCTIHSSIRWFALLAWFDKHSVSERNISVQTIQMHFIIELLLHTAHEDHEAFKKNILFNKEDLYKIYIW